MFCENFRVTKIFKCLTLQVLVLGMLHLNYDFYVKKSILILNLAPNFDDRESGNAALWQRAIESRSVNLDNSISI
jgi:hypothetical protein